MGMGQDDGREEGKTTVRGKLAITAQEIDA
jgi:hypothetical protein